jgi:hypothetical protein
VQSPALSVSFLRYESWAAFYQGGTTQLCAMIVLSNSGSCTVLCDGVGSSHEQRFVRVQTANGWQDTTSPWLSFGCTRFWLSPRKSLRVPVIVQTNLPWSVCFRYGQVTRPNRLPGLINELLPTVDWTKKPGLELWSAPIAPPK